MYTTFFQSSVDGHLDWDSLLLPLLIQLPWKWNVGVSLIYWFSLDFAFHKGSTVYIVSNSESGDYFLYNCISVFVKSCLDLGVNCRGEMPHGGFCLLMADGLRMFSICLLAICILSFQKYLFISLAHSLVVRLNLSHLLLDSWIIMSTIEGQIFFFRLFIHWGSGDLNWVKIASSYHLGVY